MAFEGLSDRLEAAFKKLKSKGALTEKDVKEAMREVRLALLEAKSETAYARVTTSSKKKKLIKRISSLAAIFVVGIFAIAMYNNSDQLMRTMNDSAVNEGIDKEKTVDLMNLNQNEELSDLSNGDNGTAQGISNDASVYGSYSYSGDFVTENDMTEGANSANDTESNSNMLIQVPESDNDSSTDSALSRGGATAYDKLMLIYSTSGAIFTGRDLTAAKYYTDLLDKELEGICFEILSCEKSDEGVWSFEVNIVSTDDENDEETREHVIYKGQDGILWTEESAEQ